MAETKKAKKHIVVFQDEEGNVLKTSFVSHEEAALPPEMPEKRGESAHHEVKFQGWDKDISCVQENLVVKAIYKEVPKEYLIMYFHENGKMLGTETVPYGQAAKEPYHPQKPQTAEYYYVFKGWNNDLSHIEKDTMAKAVFEERQRSFMVRFFHEDGTLLKEENVLYGQASQGPETPVKQPDEIYHYIFDGWDNAFDNIKENTEIHAVFSPVYNEYTVRIYEERETNTIPLERQSQYRTNSEDIALEEPLKNKSMEQKAIEKQAPKESENRQQKEEAKEYLREHLIEDKLYHYGDIIEYPTLRKKGYTLQWNIHPETVTQNEEIHASWIFSNPVGKVFDINGNQYQILNPSITNGSIRLLSYTQDVSQVQIPERVLIGDYYYFVEEIAPKAFENCLKMRVLILPDCIKVLENEALACCRRLEKITIGKSRNSRLHVMGRGVFGENEHLKEIYLNGKNLQKTYPDTFARLKKNITIYVRPENVGYINKLFQKGIKTGKICLETNK